MSTTKIPEFYLISWSDDFAEKRIARNSRKTVSLGYISFLNVEGVDLFMMQKFFSRRSLNSPVLSVRITYILHPILKTRFVISCDFMNYSIMKLQRTE